MKCFKTEKTIHHIQMAIRHMWRVANGLYKAALGSKNAIFCKNAKYLSIFHSFLVHQMNKLGNTVQCQHKQTADDKKPTQKSTTIECDRYFAFLQ